MSAASKTKTYDVVPTDARRMTKLHTPAGDIKFTSLMKLVYAYIWTFQENKERGNDDPIHTNTNVIAWEMGVSEKSVIDALKALDAAKVVIKQTVKVRGNVNSSNYVAIPPTSVVALGVTPPKPGNGKASKAKQKSEEKKENGKSEPASPGDVNEVNPAKPGCTEMQAKQAESTNQPAAIPADQNPDLAVVSASSIVEQRSGVASNDDSGGDDGTDGATSVDNEDNDPPFPPEKSAPEDIPEGFTPRGELAYGEQVEGERLGYDDIYEKAGAG
ncbi:hypothetical protein ACQEL9_004407 [Raoultella planticola]